MHPLYQTLAPLVFATALLTTLQPPNPLQSVTIATAPPPQCKKTPCIDIPLELSPQSTFIGVQLNQYQPSMGMLSFQTPATPSSSQKHTYLQLHSPQPMKLVLQWSSTTTTNSQSVQLPLPPT